MNTQLNEKALKQVQVLKNKGQKLLLLEGEVPKFDDYDSKYASVRAFVVSTKSFIDKFLEDDNTYVEEINLLLENFRDNTNNFLWNRIIYSAIEILDAIEVEIKNGWISSFKSIVAAEIFNDFLEMAKHLLNEGYKDASAVMIGGVLENHLRNLCIKNKIPVEIKNNEGVLRSIKAGKMNDELRKKGEYNLLEHKSIVSWLDLRNKAAHAKYDEYSSDQVQIMYSGVEGFLIRHNF